MAMCNKRPKDGPSERYLLPSDILKSCQSVRSHLSPESFITYTTGGTLDKRFFIPKQITIVLAPCCMQRTELLPLTQERLA